MKIQSGQVGQIPLNGKVITVNVKCHENHDHAGFPGHVRWRVRIGYNDSASSFSYYTPESNELDFRDFATCLENDASAAEMDFDDFYGEFFGGNDCENLGRKVYRACQITRNKLKCLFGDDYNDFIEWAGRDDYVD